MPISEIVRAWRDEEFRSSLSASQISELPNHPGGTIELKDGDLANTNAGATFSAIRTQCTFCCA